MPEGPEVQVIVNLLQKHLQDAVIDDIDLFYEKLDESHRLMELKGQSLQHFSRIGKYIIIETQCLPLGDAYAHGKVAFISITTIQWIVNTSMPFSP